MVNHFVRAGMLTVVVEALLMEGLALEGLEELVLLVMRRGCSGVKARLRKVVTVRSEEEMVLIVLCARVRGRDRVLLRRILYKDWNGRAFRIVGL